MPPDRWGIAPATDSDALAPTCAATQTYEKYYYDNAGNRTSLRPRKRETIGYGYDYDGLGRRASKTVSGVTTAYLLDGDEEIAEYSGATLLRRYVTGPAIDDRIARAEGSGTSNPTKTYYHTNHQGSVIAITSPAGTVGQRLSYDEYGNLTSGAVTSGEQFRYTGRRFDAETGLYYYRARHYSPALGRFLQVDPIGHGDDNNPLKNLPLLAAIRLGGWSAP